MHLYEKNNKFEKIMQSIYNKKNKKQVFYSHSIVIEQIILKYLSPRHQYIIINKTIDNIIMKKP